MDKIDKFLKECQEKAKRKTKFKFYMKNDSEKFEYEARMLWITPLGNFWEK